MDAQKAADTLKDCLAKCERGTLYARFWYLFAEKGVDTAFLDGTFTADQLEAIAFWMRHPEEVDAAAGKGGD